jgi:hypothetical protein
MRNILILGAGRSGTSMVAGTLSKAGYFMGDNLYGARENNPKGFFEDHEVNQVNEALLKQIVPNRPQWLPKFIRKRVFNRRPMQGQRWLARVPVGTEVPSTSFIDRCIERLTQRTPFCFKDPRFSYTLPAWRPFLQDIAFICVFRDPATTVTSVLKVCNNLYYLQPLSMNTERAVEVWQLMYSHILNVHRHQGDWLFIHYNQVLTQQGLDRIATFTGAEVDRNFPDPKLRRSSPQSAVSPAAQHLYQELCMLARYVED